MAIEESGYDGLAKSLHWLVFILLAVQFAVAWTMPDIGRDTKPETLINLHLSFGILIMAVVIFRLLARVLRPVPLVTANLPPWQRWIAYATHHLLYVVLLILPVLGWVTASLRGWAVTPFGLFTLPKLIPAGTLLGYGAGPIGDWHGDLSYVLLGLVGLHVAAAFYHLIVMLDQVMQRMLPRRPPNL